MIRPLQCAEDRRRRRRAARRQWKRVFVPIAVLQVEGFGRVLVVAQTLETRWSQSLRRRLWRAAQ